MAEILTMLITLTAYRPEWPEMFVLARDELAHGLDSNWLFAIEHVGSTAVPGLAAKPIIDVLAGVRSLAELASAEEFIASLGYSPWIGAPGRTSFERRNCEGQATHHLHVVAHGGTIWCDQIAFRNWLRATPRERKAYELLKRALAVRYTDTRDYSRGKDEFVRSALARSNGVA